MPGGVLYERRFGSCSAADMGWAKTLQAIGLPAAIKEGCIKKGLHWSLRSG